jgi:hypothetical protein
MSAEDRFLLMICIGLIMMGASALVWVKYFKKDD